MPDNIPTLAEALERLKGRQAINPDFFKAGASEQEIHDANASLPSPIPLMWQEVLKARNGFCLNNLEFLSASDISPTAGDDRFFVDERSPSGSFLVSEHTSGDVVVLDIARQTPDGDCPIVWVFHDDDEVGEGEKIAAFLTSEIESDALDDEE